MEAGEASDMDQSLFAQNHMPVDWLGELEEPDAPAAEASLADKASIVCHAGIIALGAGTGGWRVREVMNRIARLLGITCHVDVSLLGIEASFTQGRKHYTQVVTLHTTGVNTRRIWRIEQFVRDVSAQAETGRAGVSSGTSGTSASSGTSGQGSPTRPGSPSRPLTVAEYHERLGAIEHEKGAYGSLQVGLAAAFACGAFVFLLGGGAAEMLCAAIGAGLGNFTRSKMLGRRLNQMFSVAVSVMVACLGYFAVVKALEMALGLDIGNEAGYIGAMLFVIPGFPLITSGLDIAKLDMRSGFERFAYAFTVIAIATLAGWVVALVVGLAPGELTQPDFSPGVLLGLRLAMTFVGVFGFSIMFNSPVSMAAFAGCVGAVGNTLRLTLVDASLAPELAAFLGALTAGLLAYAAIHNADRLHLPHFPRISITVPSIVIMVPGLYMYRAVYYLAAFNVVSAMDWAFRAALIVVFLPIGLACARVLTDPRWRYCT